MTTARPGASSPLASGWHTPTLVADLNPTGDAQPGLHLVTGVDDDGILIFDANGANGHCGRKGNTTMEATPLITDGAGATVDAGSMLIPWLNGHVLTRPGGVGRSGGRTAPSKER